MLEAKEQFRGCSRRRTGRGKLFSLQWDMSVQRTMANLGIRRRGDTFRREGLYI
jgi:hypothetical protein